MDTKLARVATISRPDEVDQAIATLVLAFGTDPVARWIYPDALQYSLHTPRLFLGASSFEAQTAVRSRDGLGVALWLPPDSVQPTRLCSPHRGLGLGRESARQNCCRSRKCARRLPYAPRPS
jgi:hypothetical protein